MPPALIVCPSCACHAKSSETRCPSCDGPLRREDGSLPRAAVAVLLGLTAASAIALNACSSTGTGTTAVAFYGLAGTGGSTTSTTTKSTTTSTTTKSTTTTEDSGAGGSDGG